MWHLPLFFDPTSGQADISLPVYVATVTAQSLIIGWLYNASGGSLLVAIVAHSAHDTVDGLASPSPAIPRRPLTSCYSPST